MPFSAKKAVLFCCKNVTFSLSNFSPFFSQNPDIISFKKITLGVVFCQSSPCITTQPARMRINTAAFRVNTQDTHETSAATTASGSFTWQADAPIYNSNVNDASSTADPLKPAQHSFHYDIAHGFELRWESLDEFKKWLRKEQDTNKIELRYHSQSLPTTDEALWVSSTVYHCSRNGTGGKSQYVKRFNWQRKRQPKRLEKGCSVRLVIKTYPNTPVILGKYRSDHSHDVGAANIPYLSIPDDVKQLIETLLRDEVKPETIVRCCTFSVILPYLNTLP